MTKIRLLILDNLGVTPIGGRDAKELLEAIGDRVAVGSLIITSQFPIDHWYDYLNNDTMADAVLDRLVHNSFSLNFPGESMRRRNSAFNSPKDHQD